MGIRMSRGVKYIGRMLGRRSALVGIGGEVLGHGLLYKDVVRPSRHGPTPSSWFRRETQDLCSLPGPRIFVWATSVGGLVIRTGFTRGAIDTVSTGGTGTVTSSFSTSADNPIGFVLRQKNNVAIWQREYILPRKTGGVNACALSAFDGQGLVGREIDVLAFSS